MTWTVRLARSYSIDPDLSSSPLNVISRAFSPSTISNFADDDCAIKGECRFQRIRKTRSPLTAKCGLSSTTVEEMEIGASDHEYTAAAMVPHRIAATRSVAFRGGRDAAGGSSGG